jgi:GTP cyclohydrolase-4
MSESRARGVMEGLDIDRETIDAFLEEVPQPGHSQRGHATVTVETIGQPTVDLHEIIDVARDSMSARIYNLAKRPDEDHMTFESHSDAKFVEDCVRSMAEGIVETYPDLPNDAIVRMEQSNDESIHQHNAHAERVAEFGELKAEIEESAD